jgi:predicted phosphodiesterase
MKKIMLVTALIFITSACYKIPNDPNPGKIIKHEKLSEGHKVCVIGDSGKKSKGQRLVADALMKEGCNQVRHTGDIIYPSGIKNPEDPEFMERFYNYYSPIMDAGVPFYMTMGNHDYKLNPAAWLELNNRYEMIKFPSMYYMDIYEDICFVSLDTNSQFTKQYKWVNKIRKENQEKCKLTLAFAHHPLYSSGKHGDAILQFKLFLKKTIEGKFDAYFAGHEHNQEDYGVKKGTHYFVSGGAGEYRYIKTTPPVWAQAKLGYMVFTVHYTNNQPFLKYIFYSISDTTGEKRIEHTGVLSK